MRELFGTDGIRGKANEFPMTPERCMRLGKAIALSFRNGKPSPKIVIGKDTRISGYMLETALTSGLVSMGATVLLVGPMPTPAISHLTRSLNADAGIVISASHNHAMDNGIKVFDSLGYKLSDEMEKRVEGIIFSNEMEAGELNGSSIGKAFRVDDAKGRYVEFAKSSINNRSLSGLKVVVDCANGAAYRVAPEVLSELGAHTIVMNNLPDGLNINLGCGATSVEGLSRRVVEEKADLGLAFDGDADRLIVVDSKGNEINGDRIMAALALDLKSRNALNNNSVVATVMSNSGFEQFMNRNGINVVRTKVGDRYVIEEMRRNNYNFGGEQSGHIIFGEYSTTGDGLITALQILKLVKDKGKTVSELCNGFDIFPQVLVNVSVREKKPLEEIASVAEAIRAADSRLAGNGRVLVRYSGTENIARVMVEGQDESEIREIAGSVARTIAGELS